MVRAPLRHGLATPLIALAHRVERLTPIRQMVRPRIEMPQMPGGSFAPPGNDGENGGRR